MFNMGKMYRSGGHLTSENTIFSKHLLSYTDEEAHNNLVKWNVRM